MLEDEYIKMLAGIHGTNPYFADAEIVETTDGFELFSIDGFSETEDFFTNTPAEIIGNNIAVAVCSDLLACGLKPEILLQSWNIDDTKGKDYYREIAFGIEMVLQYYGAKCIGGDIGTANPWNYTAIVKANSKTRPITRVAARRIPFDLYISGVMGEVNMTVFMKMPMPKLAMRSPVPAEALFATDSSGGFFDTLENFRRVNHGMQLEIDVLSTISPKISKKCPSQFNPIWSLIGGAGEYELVYAVPKGMLTNGIKVGTGYFTEDLENDFQMFADGKAIGRMKSAPPDYRDIAPEQWLDATKNYFLETCAL